jgi:hypothetical protein
MTMIAVDAVIGVRLLGIARRTRQLPEAMLGMAFVLLGGLGYPLTTAARRGALGSEEGNAALMAVGLLAQNVACFGVYLMTARTFRAGEGWAQVLAWLAAAAFVGSLAGQAATDGFASHSMSPAYWLGLGTRTGAFAWAAAESCRQYRLARRRLQLGLVDPVVANRFLLFALGMGGVLAAFLVFIAGSLTNPNPAEVRWVLAATGCVGVLTAVPTWLAFLPPAAYRRHLRAQRGVAAPTPP